MELGLVIVVTSCSASGGALEIVFNDSTTTLIRFQFYDSNGTCVILTILNNNILKGEKFEYLVS